MKKSFLDSQYVLSVEILKGFLWIKVLVRFRFGFRGHGYGFGLGLGITNSKKIKKMETLHMTSLYVTYNLEKNINMCFGSTFRKP